MKYLNEKTLKEIDDRSNNLNDEICKINSTIQNHSQEIYDLLNKINKTNDNMEIITQNNAAQLLNSGLIYNSGFKPQINAGFLFGDQESVIEKINEEISLLKILFDIRFKDLLNSQQRVDRDMNNLESKLINKISQDISEFFENLTRCSDGLENECRQL